MCVCYMLYYIILNYTVLYYIVYICNYVLFVCILCYMLYVILYYIKLYRIILIVYICNYVLFVCIYIYIIPMNIHGRGSCKPFYRHKMVFTIKWLDTAYKMSGPNPNENTIFWGGLTPEHLEITYKISIKWLVPFTNGQSASQQISAPHLESNHFAIPSFWFCHSFILFPMPHSANPGLSMGNFGIVWATCP